MKMKKLLAVVLAVCMLLSFAACKEESQPQKTQPTEPTQTEPVATEPVQTQPTETQPVATEPVQTEPVESEISPLLYKVTDDQGNTVWLFGSIHVGEEYFFPLPEYVTSAYETADALAVEFDIVAYQNDMAAQMASLKKLVYTDGTTISDHIPEELYTSAVEIMKEYGVYNKALDFYYPVLWYSFIESAMVESKGLRTDLGIDLHFLTRAHEEGKKIIDVESAEFQYSMMAGFSEDLQIMLLESTVAGAEDIESYMESLHELVAAWSAGDEAAFAELLREEPEFENAREKELYAEYTAAMETNRNLSMADFAENALKSGEEVFIVVGAAHIVGDGALAQLLAERGYTVEIIGK